MTALVDTEQFPIPLQRARDAAYVLEFESYAGRYTESGIPVHRTRELQPVYPWWFAWRDRPSDSPAAYVRTALEVSARYDWLHPHGVGGAPMWLPSGDPGGLE